MPSELDVRRYVTDAVCSSKDYMDTMEQIEKYLRNECLGLSTITVFANRIGLPTFLYVDNKILRGVTVPWPSVVGETILSGIGICADVRKDGEESYVFPEEKRGKRIHYYRKPAKETGRNIDIIQSLPLAVYNRKPFGCVQFLLDDIPTDEYRSLYQAVASSIAIATYGYETEWITSRVIHALKNAATQVSGFSITIRRLRTKRNIPEEILSNYPELNNCLRLEDELSDYILHASSTMKDISEQYARFTVGQPPTFHETDVKEMMGYLRIKSSALSHQHGIPLAMETSIPEMIPTSFWDSRMVLDELLFNLVKNAWEAFDEKTTERRIDIGAEEHDGKIKFVIRDNAGGISHPENLFDGTSTKGFGRGIGLLSAQQVARYHEGSISYAPVEESNELVGSLFTVELPIKPSIMEHSSSN